MAMPWRVEILNETVPGRSRRFRPTFRRSSRVLGERICVAGLESLRAPHVRHLEGKLWEMRLNGRDGIARALYVTVIGQRIVILRAFVKKTQATPRSEIEIALSRAGGIV